ncbi:hypothetical protein D0463_07060 [Bacillus sp. V59.32b]|nr:hypothetical protein D0463_07060 [Bacillus sp. V59.32b]
MEIIYIIFTKHSILLNIISLQLLMKTPSSKELEKVRTRPRPRLFPFLREKRKRLARKEE